MHDDNQKNDTQCHNNNATLYCHYGVSQLSSMLNNLLIVAMLIVAMLSVIMLTVIIPTQNHNHNGTLYCHYGVSQLSPLC
jgi:hypothetical protein